MVEGKVFSVDMRETTARGIWKNPEQGGKIWTELAMKGETRRERRQSERRERAKETEREDQERKEPRAENRENAQLKWKFYRKEKLRNEAPGRRGLG